MSKQETFPILQAENIHIGGSGSINRNCACIGRWAGHVFPDVSGFGWFTSHIDHPFFPILKEELVKRGLSVGTGLLQDANDELYDRSEAVHKQLLADAWNAAGYRYGFNELP